jgi:putative endonuclease
MKNCWVYILSSKSKTLYLGVTNDLQRRIFEHKHKLIDGFTKKYNLTSLVYFETFNNMRDAIQREKQLKNWHREWKIILIESINPDWKDLTVDFNTDPETSSG